MKLQKSASHLEKDGNAFECWVIRKHMSLCHSNTSCTTHTKDPYILSYQNRCEVSILKGCFCVCSVWQQFYTL
jgi:hypothetical protein